MISEPVKHLGEYDLDMDLISGLNSIYFQYGDVELYKNTNFNEAAKAIAEHFFPEHTITVLNARVHKMPSKSTLQRHTDGIPTDAEFFHVLHLPLKTNPGAYLAFDSGKHHMKEGNVYEFNYNLPHWGGNDGDTDRYHLFMEIYAYEKIINENNNGTLLAQGDLS